MSQTSLIYRNAALYEAIMRMLYGRHYRDRLAAVAAQVPNGATVVELCCGPGTLYERHLSAHVCCSDKKIIGTADETRLAKLRISCIKLSIDAILGHFKNAEDFANPF